MKQMKRWLSLFMAGVMAFSLCLFLGACGDSGNGDPDKDGGNNNDDGDIYVTSLTVKTMPQKTDYYVGDTMDWTGIELTALWNDGEEETLNQKTVESRNVKRVPDGPLALTDAKINLTYEGASCDVPIRVTVEEIGGLRVEMGNLSSRVLVGTKLNFGSFKVYAQYDGGDEREIATYTITMNGTPIEDKNNVVLTEKGVYTFKVEYGNKDYTFTVEAYTESLKIEAEDFVEVGKQAEEGRKNYVEAVRYSDAGALQHSTKMTEDTSGTGYMGNVVGYKWNAGNGAKIRVHIWSDKAQNAKIDVYASSSYVLTSGDGTKWHPNKTGDLQFNKVFSVKFGTAAEALSGELQDVTIDDGVIIYGGEVEGPNGTGSWTLYNELCENWTLLPLGTFALKEGDNVIELENINVDYRDLEDRFCGVNLDYVSVEFLG